MTEDDVMLLGLVMVAVMIEIVVRAAGRYHSQLKRRRRAAAAAQVSAAMTKIMRQMVQKIVHGR